MCETKEGECLKYKTIREADRCVGKTLTTSHQVDELPKDDWVTEATETEGESVRRGREGVGVANLFCSIYLGLKQLIHQTDKQLGLC